MTTGEEQIGTRQRLIKAMRILLQHRGLHGIGLRDILAQAQAPKGVLYHHFPGGKTELADVAIQSAIDDIIEQIQKLQTNGQPPVQILRHWIDYALKGLEKSDFEQGCPLAAVGLESVAEDHLLRRTLDEGFEAIRGVLVELLEQAGMAGDRARRYSVLIVAAYEGALLQSRVAESLKPANETLELLLELIQHEIVSARHEHEYR